MSAITKKVQRSEDLYIQFSNEELNTLNLKCGDKLSCRIKDNEVILEKFVPIDVDLSEWSREVLEMLIIQSVEQDLSVNDVICNMLDKAIKDS